MATRPAQSADPSGPGPDPRGSCRGWTVEGLATRVGDVSIRLRGAALGPRREPPLAYLTRWRMHRAGRLLATSHLRLHEIAAQVDYDSAPFTLAMTI